MTLNQFLTKQSQLVTTALLFPIFTYFALYLDSNSFATNYFDGKYITTILSVGYFSWMFWSADKHLRQLLCTMVILSYIGELIFCDLLKMYAYRMGSIPLYVPFGHAIVFGSGYIFASLDFFKTNEIKFRKWFIISYLILFILVAILFNDLFTGFFGICFLALIRRKKWQQVYFLIALCVIYIELVGTYFECWRWYKHVLGIIPTANPPIGAVFFYAGGDVLLVKIIASFNARSKKTHL